MQKIAKCQTDIIHVELLNCLRKKRQIFSGLKTVILEKGAPERKAL